MKGYKKILFGIFTVFFGCKNYDELVKDPNLPTSVPAASLLTGILNSMTDENAWNGKQGSMSAAQFYVSTYKYYGSNNYDQSPFLKSSDSYKYYYTLENIERMDIEAKNSGLGTLNGYTALGKFLRAYYFNLMSQKMGDIPMSKAVLGSVQPSPIYDTQKDIYTQVLKYLDDANSDLNQLISSGKTTVSGGDIFLKNDLRAWQKVVNAFTLRVLVSLSKKQADLGIPQKFANIINNPVKYPLMTGNGDNLQEKYDATYNPYPKNPNSRGEDGSRENVASTFLDLTTSLNDPRTFIAATPAPAQLIGGKTFTDFSAYVGAPAGASMSDLGNNAQGGQYSYINAFRYYSTFDGSSAEPAIIIGYPEICFNIAEGLNRSWTPGNAGDWYLNGIKASMSMFGISDGSSISVGDNLATKTYGTVTNISVTNYLAQPSVSYKGGTDGLTQILQQKYIAFWQNSNWEAFFNQRRTGIPTYSTGPGTGNGGKVAVRWQYPAAETSSNPTNYTSAVGSQYGATDNLDGVMWILK